MVINLPIDCKRNRLVMRVTLREAVQGQDGLVFKKPALGKSVIRLRTVSASP